MSKIVMITEVPGTTYKEYDAILSELNNTGKLPAAGCLSHVAFQKDNSWCVVDVWESKEACMEFAQNTLFPIFGRLGITPAQPAFFAAHNFIPAGEVMAG
ncbi:hypothetical protein [Ferruginibacter sp.]